MSKNFLLFILITLFNVTAVVAQDDGLVDPPPAPVNQYVVIAAIIAIGFVFAYFYKRRSLQSIHDINL